MSVAHSANAGQSELFNVLEVYSSADEIRTELARRSSDKILVKRLAEFWGEFKPTFLAHSGAQYGFFSRPVVTPNMETRYFLDTAKTLGLEPLVLEYPGKFVSKNKEKRFAAKLRFFRPIEDGRTRGYFHKNIVDFKLWEGRPFQDVSTTKGGNLIDVHHSFFLKKYSQWNGRIIDISDWFDAVRTHYPYYYLGFLSLFLVNGVLFENFIMDDEQEREFFYEKVLPGFLAIRKEFGIKPLIYPVLPLKYERDVAWLSYPASDEEIVGDILGYEQQQ